MNKRLLAALFETIITIVGYVLLLNTDWKLAVGAFLVIWGNNIGLRLNK